MSGKRLPKNLDLSKNLDVAAGFFSNSEFIENDIREKITVPTKDPSDPNPTAEKKKNLGGRPQKEGLKNEQFTLTMHPELYEKLRILAGEYTRGNFSGLIDEAIKSFCRENNIDLSAVQVDPEILDLYKQKQEKKRKK